MNITPAMINAQIAKGTFRPHTALTNVALSYYQNAANYFAKAIFPICRVSQSSDSYYIFSKEDLLRDGWQRKPSYGKVNPVVLSEHMETYNCKVDQMIMGIDQIRQTDLNRRQAPRVANQRMQRTKAIAEQDFFRAGVWANEWTGVDDTSVTGNQLIKFSNHNSDPIKFIDERKREIHQNTGRMPNRLALGTEVVDALKLHPAILERVKYGGSTANPANVTENVLAQLFGVEKLVELKSIHNQAKMGADADMNYIGDSKSMLLAYATDNPSLEEPSAGYIFTWDMLGDGQILPILQYQGENGTHSEYIEGLMACDMKKTADDLAVFCAEVV